MQPKQIEKATIVLKANVYFDGKVVSHTILDEAGAKKTVGLIYPGTYQFNTGDPERMDILSGSCQVKLANTVEWQQIDAGNHFNVAANSSFEIQVHSGLTEYLCTFIK